MLRLVLLLLITVSLGYQHASCCAHPATDLRGLPPLTHSHGDTEGEGDHDREDGECPHTHHICVGSHVFFVCHNASDQQAIHAAIVLWGEVVCFVEPFALVSPTLSPRGFAAHWASPPAPTLPLRAELQVYLI